MMFPKELLYTKDHEWIKIEDNMGTIGITDHAQHALGDITFVELPKIGNVISQGQEICALESAKAASSVFLPMSGCIVTTNLALEENPSLVNTSPYKEGWICKINISSLNEKGNLMNSEEYEKFLIEE